MSSSFRDASGVREREGMRILERHSCTHVQRDTRSSYAANEYFFEATGEGTERAIRERRRSRASMGARERKDRRISLRMIHGDAKREARDCGFGDGVEATVWRISPI